MNEYLAMGRLTRDPEVRYTAGEQPMAVATFALAIDKERKVKEGEPTADFVRFKALGKTAEFAERYLSKGRRIAVRAAIESGSYVDKEGNRKYTEDKMVKKIWFADGGSGAASTAPAAAENHPAETADDGFMDLADFGDEDLPFN